MRDDDWDIGEMVRGRVMKSTRENERQRQSE